MKRSRLLTAVLAAGAAAGLAACNSESTTNLTQQLVTDQQVTADVALATGDAIANDVGELILNEASAGFLLAPSFDLFGSPPGVTVIRHRTCFDAQGNAQAACDASTTASVLVVDTIFGSFQRIMDGPMGSDTMTAAVHRTRSLTISGLLGTETSRTHNGAGSSNDTTTFSGVHDGHVLSRTMIQSSLDSIVNVVFNLPHATNPFPVSGRIVKYLSGSITFTVNGQTETRTINRTVEVTFPPDAQGNVTITITNGGITRTCQLNLVTHRVANCT